jgi:spore photoproduct lyase
MDYSLKFESLIGQTLFDRLSSVRQDFLRRIALEYRLSHQEVKTLVEWDIDLSMWQGKSLEQYWNQFLTLASGDRPSQKAKILKSLSEEMGRLKNTPRQYSDFEPNYQHRPRTLVTKTSQQDKIFGACPVASEQTVCCNLYTIDAVKNCGFSCSYCSIQTMYKEPEILFDADFAKKIDAIELEPNRFYHVGTGQSSDALLWGNRFGILDAMVGLARRNPQALIEFKTKSKNVKYFLEEKDLPKNIVCSWSLNPDIIIKNEEHLAATLEERLRAAEQVAEKGILVAFHFHPMFWFENWEAEYANIFTQIQSRFKPEQITFISFGTLTFPKPILNKIRNYEYNTKILQMPLVPNPEKKWTYPPEIKKLLFTKAYQAFASWHSSVFFYLCMEETRYWNECFGYTYSTNALFERALGESSMAKVYSRLPESVAPVVEVSGTPA